MVLNLNFLERKGLNFAMDVWLLWEKKALTVKKMITPFAKIVSLLSLHILSELLSLRLVRPSEVLE